MQKLIIDNFKQITHAELEVNDFLLLISPLASGKSTTAKLRASRSLRAAWDLLSSLKNEIEVFG